MTNHRRKTIAVDTVVRNQTHRADPANTGTANCAMWLSPEQLDAAHYRHTNAGRKLIGTVPCVCGNHDRRMYA